MLKCRFRPLIAAKKQACEGVPGLSGKSMLAYNHCFQTLVKYRLISPQTRLKDC
jgi:hypothetical protein